MGSTNQAVGPNLHCSFCLVVLWSPTSSSDELAEEHQRDRRRHLWEGSSRPASDTNQNASSCLIVRLVDFVLLRFFAYFCI